MLVIWKTVFGNTQFVDYCPEKAQSKDVAVPLWASPAKQQNGPTRRQARFWERKRRKRKDSHGVLHLRCCDYRIAPGRAEWVDRFWMGREGSVNEERLIPIRVQGAIAAKRIHLHSISFYCILLHLFASIYFYLYLCALSHLDLELNHGILIMTELPTPLNCPCNARHWSATRGVFFCLGAWCCAAIKAPKDL